VADLDQIQELDEAIRYSEADALQALADHLRAAVKELPSESRLPLVFVQHADMCEHFADARRPALWAGGVFDKFRRDLRDLDGGA
jgi:hypothetical protein